MTNVMLTNFKWLNFNLINQTMAATDKSADNLSDFYQENKKLVNEYVETRLEIFKLTSIRILSKLLSVLLLIFITSFMLLFFLLFLVIAFSWFISDIIGSAALGFLSGGALFLIIMVVCIVFRKPLFVNPFIRLFLRASLQEENEEEDEY
jgi:uncharacterized membrane protein